MIAHNIPGSFLCASSLTPLPIYFTFFLPMLVLNLTLLLNVFSVIMAVSLIIMRLALPFLVTWLIWVFLVLTLQLKMVELNALSPLLITLSTFLCFRLLCWLNIGLTLYLLPPLLIHIFVSLAVFVIPTFLLHLLTNCHLVLLFVFSWDTLPATKGIIVLISPPFMSLFLVMSPLMNHLFPLLSETHLRHPSLISSLSSMIFFCTYHLFCCRFSCR